MKISENGKKLLKELEGLRLEAYQCSAGVWTIGYGHTSTAKQGMKITCEKAEVLLKSDLIRFEKCLNSSIKTELTQNQYDALVCFIFNIGCAAFLDSSMLECINNKDFKKAAWWFSRWNIANGKPCAGLIRRRAIEKELFCK